MYALSFFFLPHRKKDRIKGSAADKVGHGAKRNHGESVHRTNFIRVNPYVAVDLGAEGC